MTNFNWNEMKTVKAMVFTKGSNILTVVSAVPETTYRKSGLISMGNGKFRPDSCGTFLYPRLLGTDPMLLCTPVVMSLTDYEKHLASIGYKFCCTIKETRGKTISESFMFSRIFIRGRFNR